MKIIKKNKTLKYEIICSIYKLSSKKEFLKKNLAILLNDSRANTKNIFTETGVGSTKKIFLLDLA